MDIVVLTNCIILDPEENHKDHPFCFMLDRKDEKKWRTYFSPDSLEETVFWKSVMQKNISITKTTVFGTTVQDGCMKVNKLLPNVIEQCVQFIQKRFFLFGNV